MLYNLMFYDDIVLQFDHTGVKTVIAEDVLPFALQTNLTCNSFLSWLQDRALQLNRLNRDAILIACGLSRDGFDKNILFRYHALSLTDNYWVCYDGEDVSYAKINLYENSFNNSLVAVALLGNQTGLTISKNSVYSTPELTLRGTFAKCYDRTKSGIYLYKAESGSNTVEREVFASKVAELLNIRAVKYSKVKLSGVSCARCALATSLSVNWCTARDFELSYTSAFDFAKKRYPFELYELLILDYLINNSDRHAENWAFEYDSTNNIIGLSPCYDFNLAFNESENLLNLMTLESLKVSATKAYKLLRNRNRIGENYFAGLKQYLRKTSAYNSDYIKLVLRHIDVLELEYKH